MSLKLNLKCALGGALALALLAPTAAFAGDRVGTLNCKLTGNDVSIIVENQAVDCLFQDGDVKAMPSHYIGKLTKVGANLTVNGPGELGWGVVAETDHVGPGALAGEYVGPNAGVKLGVGGGGALLVGGSNNTFSLQPLQVEAGTGLGVTAGVQSLELTYVPPPPPPPRKRSHHHHHHHHHH